MDSITILIVDDELAFTEVIALRLNKRNFIVRTANNGNTALKWLRDDEKIEVVILDIAMPGMNGIETLKVIKKEYPLIETIMVTGQGTIDTAVEATKLGAYNYLLKPCDLEDLILSIEKAIKRKRSREAKILDIRMQPYISPCKRQEMIDAILQATNPEEMVG
jgi:DNA-binding NtrC family response regulator